MRHSNLIACLWLGGALFFVLIADVSSTSLNLLGMEDMSCAAWKRALDPERREPYLQWVRGFLSGHNYANPSAQVNEVSKATVATFVDRYCAEHADSTVSDAAMRMSDRYSGRNSPITR